MCQNASSQMLFILLFFFNKILAPLEAKLRLFLIYKIECSCACLSVRSRKCFLCRNALRDSFWRHFYTERDVRSYEYVSKCHHQHVSLLFFIFFVFLFNRIFLRLWFLHNFRDLRDCLHISLILHAQNSLAYIFWL